MNILYKNIFIFIGLIILLCGFTSGCTQGQHGAIGAPTNVKVINIHGGATINYKLPSGDSLQYVKATVQAVDGKKIQERSSFYQSQITINGLADTSAKKVILQAVGRGGSVSESVEVTIHPLAAPALLAVQNMSLETTTDGLRLSLINPTDSDLEVTVLGENTSGNIRRLNRYYSTREKQSYILLGTDRTEKLGVFIRDQSNIYSDTVFVKLDTLDHEIVNKLTNSTYPIEYGAYDGQRWGSPAGWRVNEAVKIHDGFGGADNYESIKGAQFSIEVWWGAGSLRNGKIMQTITLPPGNFALDGYCRQHTGSTVVIREGSEAYLIVTKEKILPDTDRINTALGFVSLKKRNPSIDFTLPDTTRVTIGFLGNYIQQQNAFRCSSVALRQL